MREYEGNFEVIWESDDGYCGASRPHSLFISPDEIEDCDDDEPSLERLLEDRIENDFQEKVHPYATNRDEFIAWAKSIQEAEGQNE